MRKNKNTSKIVLIVIVAGLATMVTYNKISTMKNELAGKEQMIELMQNSAPSANQANFAYAVATKDLKAGEIVADTDVDFKQFPQADATAFDNRSEVVNKVLLQDITMGSAFTGQHIAKVAEDSDGVGLRPGYRSLTLPAETFQGRSAKMIAGTRVDIFSVDQEASWSMDNVKILSLEGAAANATNVTNATSIDFEVPADRIADFISTASKSKLVLVVRNPNDKKITRKKSNYISGIPAAPHVKNYGQLPNLPPNVPVNDLPGENLNGLPAPIKPAAPAQEVEMIEANVKSKVTFD